MATFFLFGKYSAASLKEISTKRTQTAADIVKKLGGEMKGLWALLGEHDLVMMVELPGINEAMKCSLSLAKESGIGFTTAPAITVEQFDKLVAG